MGQEQILSARAWLLIREREDLQIIFIFIFFGGTKEVALVL